ncbi:PucR family transcriptional regulator [Gordonia spumicola]|nr:helix-turn-helix domain-containing protein [Gordonia spumicola]
MTEALTDRPPLLTRVREQWDSIAAKLLEGGLAATTPDGLPDDHFNADVLPAITMCGYALFEAVSTGRDLTFDEVRVFAGPVAERHAEDRLPLQMLLTGIHESAQILLTEAAAIAEDDEMADMLDLGKRMLNMLGSITLSVVSAYTEVEQSIYHAEREARRELCAALIDGRPAAGLAARADTTIADRYLVLSLRVDVDASPVSAAHLITRRRRRLLQQILDELTSSTTPAVFDGVVGTALIPESSVDIDDAARWAAMTARLTAEFDADVHMILTAGVSPEHIPASVADGTELARLACALRRPSGAYSLDDLLLEYQITRPSPARDRLADRVAPLFTQPHLLESLQAHLKHGANRKDAAKEVFVHPNTFTYRLRRVAELTGLDPADPYESRMLAAALTISKTQEPAAG